VEIVVAAYLRLDRAQRFANGGYTSAEQMLDCEERCHAKVERTQMVLSEKSPLLLELWREKHPQGLEQFALDFEKCNESSPYPSLLICLGYVMNPV
jgi:hypothetical protein